MTNKELTISWVGALIGSGLADVNVFLGTITYITTIIFTGIKIYQHLKKEDNGNTRNE
jgi:CO dehydrogenase/acetyl-CoA synthase epsilon subunit